MWCVKLTRKKNIMGKIVLNSIYSICSAIYSIKNFSLSRKPCTCDFRQENMNKLWCQTHSFLKATDKKVSCPIRSKMFTAWKDSRKIHHPFRVIGKRHFWFNLIWFWFLIRSRGSCSVGSCCGSRATPSAAWVCHAAHLPPRRLATPSQRQGSHKKIFGEGIDLKVLSSHKRGGSRVVRIPIDRHTSLKGLLLCFKYQKNSYSV